MEKKAITIFTANVARKLIKDGYTLVDIKPDKTDVDGKRTVFVFKNENNIMEKIREYKEKQISERGNSFAKKSTNIYFSYSSMFSYS